jgi:outer membrane receptor protein involved in Fe transport
MTRWLAATCLLLTFSVPARAQTSQVSGTVVDDTGAGVPGATVELAGTAGRHFTTSGPGGLYTFSNVASGRYTVTVSLVGFSRAVSDGITAAGESVTVPPVTVKVANLSETVVVSATKSGMALVDAPATMSVLTNADIMTAPSQNYGDLLRNVPGLNVVQLSARDVNLSTRQATSTLSKSELVVLDGRSVYLDFFDVVLWDLLPANMSDIKQIEVIRGPASAVWGAAALTGVINIITKSPREATGEEATFTGGFMSRDAGSTAGMRPGGIFGANATFAAAPNATWSYRVSGGYFQSDAFPRPTGTIPVIADPRIPGATVGGAAYPVFANPSTSQPKFEARVDQELGRNGRLTYEGGVAGTQGVIHTGLGPFEIQSGSYLAFGRVNYTRNALKLNFFSNVLHADAPNLLFLDAGTSQPLLIRLTTPTYDVEVGDAVPIGRRHVVSFGGNYRHNIFDITLTPLATDRHEGGAYVQDDVFLGRVRLNIGGRVDKFRQLADPVFSPRLAAVVRLAADQSLRLSFNRAFRSPAVIHTSLQANVVVPTDLRPLASLLPAAFQPLVANPFPLVVRAIGSEIPIGATPQARLTEESLTAYEVAYTGTVKTRTTMSLALYLNDLRNSIDFVPLPATLDPYTAADPPPGWQLPPGILAVMAQRGIYLPHTGFTYLNLGPLRQKGLEASIDHRFSERLAMFANYSWQSRPEILSDPNPYPASELAYPPTNTFNAGFRVDSGRCFGNFSVNYSDKAFWSDVLTSSYHGYTDQYAMVNGTIGARWLNGKLTTSVKTTNMLNQDIQQHIFGDILKRTVVLEARIKP